MLLAKGSKVKLKSSGELARVTSILDANIVQVRLDKDGLEIPIFIEDLERPGDYNQHIKYTPFQTSEINHALNPTPEHSQYATIHKNGFQLGFVFEPDKNQYRIYLINDDHLSYVFTLKKTHKGQSIQTVNGQIVPSSFQQIGYLDFSSLSDCPSFNLTTWIKNETGSGAKADYEIRTKPSNFFKPTRVIPLINQPGIYFEFKIKKTPTPPKELIKAAKELTSKTNKRTKWSNTADMVLEKAEFSVELDLHYDTLCQRKDIPSKKAHQTILEYQLFIFDNYLWKAHNLAMDKVFIIHGVGEGVLKKALESKLKFHPAVQGFLNEYHPKYGWGATEVRLR